MCRRYDHTSGITSTTQGTFVNLFGIIWRHRAAWLFAGASFILLSASLWTVVRALETEVQNTSEAANTTLTRALVNAHWDALGTMLHFDGDVGLAKANPRLPAVDGLIRTFSRDTDLVKVKIYDLKGLTLYSSDPAQIGENKSGNAGFIQASKGRVVSELTYRGKFGGFDGDLYQRNLVSSYVPVYGTRGVEAVVEVYTDRTEAIDRVEHRMVQLSALLAALFGVVFGLLFAYTRRPAPASAPHTVQGGNSAAPTPADDSDAVFKEVSLQLAGSLAQRSQALQALASDLLSTPLDGPQTSLVGRLADLGEAEDTQARHLLWLHDVLISPRRQEAKGFDLNALLRESFQRHADGARARGLEVQCHVAQELPSSFTGDPELTARLLDLLLLILCGRAAQGVLQLKAQLGPRGPQIDLISSGSQHPFIETLERHLVDRLAQQLGGELHIQASSDSGGWFTLMLPMAHKGEP